MPKRGLEPPHPCEYMTLNHARLPIPPLRPEEWDKYRSFCNNVQREIMVTGANFPWRLGPRDTSGHRMTDTMGAHGLLTPFDVRLDGRMDGHQVLHHGQDASANEDVPTMGQGL